MPEGDVSHLLGNCNVRLGVGDHLQHFGNSEERERREEAERHIERPGETRKQRERHRGAKREAEREGEEGRDRQRQT